VPLGSRDCDESVSFILFISTKQFKRDKKIKKKKKDPEAPLIVSKYDEALQQNVTKCVF